MIRVLIGDKNFLSRVGLELLVGELRGFSLAPTVCGDGDDLTHQITLSKPDLLILDYMSLGMSESDVKTISLRHKKMRILAITELVQRPRLDKVLDCGATSYLLKDCDKSEILEAINSTIKGEKFICGKIVSILSAASEITPTNAFIKSLGCDGFPVTEREIDIIRGIAEGLSNKMIADKLQLSTHTVNTHRKNIMAKLGVNNTAGVVMFAVKNGLLETNFELFNS